jgi:hypothetical protein
MLLKEQFSLLSGSLRRTAPNVLLGVPLSNTKDLLSGREQIQCQLNVTLLTLFTCQGAYLGEAHKNDAPTAGAAPGDDYAIVIPAYPRGVKARCGVNRLSRSTGGAYAPLPTDGGIV